MGPHVYATSRNIFIQSHPLFVDPYTCYPAPPAGPTSQNMDKYELWGGRKIQSINEDQGVLYCARQEDVVMNIRLPSPEWRPLPGKCIGFGVGLRFSLDQHSSPTINIMNSLTVSERTDFLIVFAGYCIRLASPATTTTSWVSDHIW